MTWFASRQAPSAAATVEPLGARLTRVENEAARISHVVFDGRASSWLQSTLEDAQMRFGQRKFDAPVVILRCEAAEGPFELVVEKADLGAAIDMALDLPDTTLACQVLSALLRKWAERLQPLLSGLRVVSFEQQTSGPETVTLFTHGVRIGLAKFGDGVVDHIAACFAQSPSTNLSVLAPLMVRARLKLLTRRWPRSVIDGLSVGDVVLVPGSATGRPRSLLARLIFGMGVTMDASAEISMDDSTVQVNDMPAMGNDDGEIADAGESGGTGLDALQLPVSFEIDTARISLAEMADIQPGYVVELDVPLPEATVRLICHGQTVGMGQLVAVGSQLGVRITRMGIQHDTLAHR